MPERRKKPIAVDPAQLPLFPNEKEVPKTANAEMALSVRQLLRTFPGSTLVSAATGSPPKQRSKLTTERDRENGN